MSTQLLRRYLDIINEAQDAEKEQSDLLPINDIAGRYKFLPTSKQDLTYHPHNTKVDETNVEKMPQFSYAVVAKPFTLETITADGLETTQPVDEGWIIISGPSGEKYYNKPDKFAKNYPVKKADGAVGPDTSVKRMVAQHTGNESGTIPVSYGGTSALKPGDYLVLDADSNNPDSKYYRIAKFEYENTYNPPGE